MNLQQRIELMGRLGDYMRSEESEWIAAKARAYTWNNWFIPDFIDKAVDNITGQFLQREALTAWAEAYPVKTENTARTVGVIMAGNIPLVGFHDFLCVFLSGHRQRIKISSKDDVLLPFLIKQLIQWEPSLANSVEISPSLKGCDAYIATGSNNSSRYFDYYFGKYPSIIRRNRTSVAVLSGAETTTDLEKLADDVQLYFGLGCRNVTKLYVPKEYDFLPLLNALRKYQFFFDHNKYRNNYDYQLAIYLMNNQFYMTNDSIVLVEHTELFSPIGTLYYEFYEPNGDLSIELSENQSVQCITGKGGLPFGSTQSPSLQDYADGVDTMAFLSTL